MSEVYLAIVAGPAGFNKLMVVKLIKGELAEDPDFISMFLEEARLSARLNHPNIVQTNEVGHHNGRYFIAMEYLEGQPYSRIVNRLGRDRGLPLGMGLRILSDVLAGLHYAHELPDFDGSALGVVHRDVTPHNVFVTYDGQVKVVDFGIAKAMNSSHETRTGMLKGKVGYMAPEQARGERVDRRADVFSVGVMLWEAAVGRRMWKGMSEVQVLHNLLGGELPRPRDLRPDVSEHLDAIIMRALSIDREGRQSTCLELQTELDELMDAGSERTTLREVGRRISGVFAEERQKLKQIIESQVAKSTALNTGMYQQAELPVVDHPMTAENPALRYDDSMRPPGVSQSMPRFGNSGSHPSQSGGYPSSGPMHTPSGSYPMPPNVPSVMPQNAQPPSSYSHPHTPHSYPSHPSHPGSHPRESPMTGSIARANLSHGTFTPASPAQSARRMTLVALAVAMAAAGLVALLYVSVGRSGLVGKRTEGADPATQNEAPKTTAAQATSDAPSSTTSPSASQAKTQVSVKIVVKPKDATIYLDDKKLESNPVEITRDDKEHKLRIEAPGYQSRTRAFTAADDLLWDLELSPDGRGGHAPVVKKETPQPPPPKEDGKMQVTPVVRPVDTSYTP